MRTDAKKNLRKVAGAVAKDPLKTTDEIAKEIGLSHGNVHDKLTKLDKIDKNADIVSICDADIDIVKEGQKLTSRWIKGFGKSIPRRDDINTMTTAMRESQKRYSVFAGNVTDEKGGLISPEVKQAMEELLDSME